MGRRYLKSINFLIGSILTGACQVLSHYLKLTGRGKTTDIPFLATEFLRLSPDIYVVGNVREVKTLSIKNCLHISRVSHHLTPN